MGIAELSEEGAVLTYDKTGTIADKIKNFNALVYRTMRLARPFVDGANAVINTKQAVVELEFAALLEIEKEAKAAMQTAGQNAVGTIAHIGAGVDTDRKKLKLKSDFEEDNKTLLSKTKDCELSMECLLLSSLFADHVLGGFLRGGNRAEGDVKPVVDFLTKNVIDLNQFANMKDNQSAKFPILAVRIPSEMVASGKTFNASI